MDIVSRHDEKHLQSIYVLLLKWKRQTHPKRKDHSIEAVLVQAALVSGQATAPQSNSLML